MSEIYMVKRHGQLVPMSDGDADVIHHLANGEVYRLTLTKPRNGKFHRKYFALLDVLYSIFNPVAEWKGDENTD